MVEWSSLSSNKSLLLVTAAGLAVAGAIYLANRKQQQSSGTYELVGEVASLHVFPIKSCGELTSDVAYCTKTGMRMLNMLDRHFVIVKENGDFITQRQISKMAGVKTSVEGQELVLTSDEMPAPLRVPINPPADPNKTVNCRVWKDRLDAQSCGEAAGAWLSQYLGEEGLQLLVLLPGMTKRPTRSSLAKSTDKVGFPDKCPYHLATVESLADLNSRINSPEGPVSFKNFRPNIVIKGTRQAWDEDNWAALKIGKSVKMRVLEPCDRCNLTQVDPQRKERRKDEEPLVTLRKFRMFPENTVSPMFGIFAGLDEESTIRVGDPVYAIRK